MPDLPRPQCLRQNDIAENQQHVGEAVWTGHPVPIHEALILVAAIPGKERFHGVAISDNQAGSQHQFGG